MIECTYTNEKHKKSKKWSDGYVSRTGTMVKLYNENKVVISTSSFKVNEEDLLETGLYLIYVDNLDSFNHESNTLCKDNNELKDVTDNITETESSIKKIKTADNFQKKYTNPYNEAKSSVLKKDYKNNKIELNLSASYQLSKKDNLDNDEVLELPKLEGRDFNEILGLFK